MTIPFLAMMLSLAGSAQCVVPGLEVLLSEQKVLVEGKRVGIITNHTGVDRRMQHIVDLLREQPGVRVTALFAPEHGIRGISQAGDKVVDAVDQRSGIPVYSIYGKTTRPTAAMLKGVDVLIYDIQDVGARFYTYISTLGECMQAAAEQGIPFVVLDRPNPVGGVVIEGGMLDLAFKSFVGAYRIPIRYGWTLGELAGFIRDGLKKDVKLTVVKMKNYRRAMSYPETGLQWVAPSPNIPSAITAMVYPGMCLFEGTNISEGRGTTQPFEMIGAPWLDGYRLAKALAALNLPGALFRPAGFTPTFSKYQGQACQGIQVHVTDFQTFRPVTVALHILRIVKQDYPEKFEWRDSIDRLSGSDRLRRLLDEGAPVEKILGSCEPELKEFDTLRKRYALYP